MLQTKIFLSDENADSSSFCMAEDYFNAWMAENPNLIIKDVKYQHVMTEESDYVKQSSSIMVLFEVPEGDSELFTRFKWNEIWNRSHLYVDKLKDKEWLFNKRKEDPHFPFVGKLPSVDTPVLIKLENGTYKLSKRVYSYDYGYYYFEGIADEHFYWQYLPE